MVLQMMTPLELIDLAQVSKRTRNLVKFGAKEYKMKLCTDGTIWIRSGRKNFTVRIHKEVKKSPKRWYRCFNDEQVAVYKSNDGLDTFWQDTDHGVKQLAKYLRTVFDCTFYELSISLNEEQFQPFTQYFLNLQKSISELYIGYDSLPNQHLVEFLDSMDVTEKLTLYTHFREDFIYEFKKVPKLTHVGRYFNRDNLMSSSWTNLYVEASCILTNQDLDFFVQKWKSGGFPDLKFAIISSFRINTLTRIDGHIPPIRNRRKTTSDFKRLVTYAVDVNDGVEVVRIDGVKATLSVLIEHPCSTFVLYVRK
ncbi:hypothetical protein CAEBREN_20220 [Caenorhabditis brenneri]|uniref:F-box associated domain-containing protein n=1 Tax=Caenorhabditis brenneri TaxID=135651 RepID=G0N7V6_CAEBE|nr:hypothetical protein CAEBREN_20220 [Caenorhabditis brenneri]